MPAADTIVAAATPPGRGGVAIVRASGPEVPRLAAELLGSIPVPRFATFTRWHDADAALIDTGLALYFPAPHSFTGEHVLELHGHGGAFVVESLIERLVQLGARRARPGEFTQQVHAARDGLTALRVYVEAAIDFPEEEIDFLASQELRERLQFVQQN